MRSHRLREEAKRESRIAIAGLAITLVSVILTALALMVDLSFFRRVVGIIAALVLTPTVAISLILWRRFMVHRHVDGSVNIELLRKNAAGLTVGALLAIVFLVFSVVFLFPEPLENSPSIQTRLLAWSVITPAPTPSQAFASTPPALTIPASDPPSTPAEIPTSVPSTISDDLNADALEGEPVQVYHADFRTIDWPGYWQIDDLESLRRALTGIEAESPWELGGGWWEEHIMPLNSASPSASAYLSFSIKNRHGLHQANLERILFEVKRDPVAPIENIWMSTPGLGGGSYRGYGVPIDYDSSAYAREVQTFAALPGEGEGFDFITLLPGEQESIWVNVEFSAPGLYHITPRAVISYQDQLLEIPFEQSRVLVPDRYRVWGFQSGQLVGSPIVVDLSTKQYIYEGEVNPAHPPILFASSMVNGLAYRAFVLNGILLTSPIDEERWQGFNEVRWSDDGSQILTHCPDQHTRDALWCAVDLATGELSEIGLDSPDLEALQTPGPMALEMGTAATKAIEAEMEDEAVTCSAEVWSPSGEKVVVVCRYHTDEHTGFPHGNEAELWVADSSGALKRITRDRGYYRDPVWSQDEQRLLVCGDALRVFDTTGIVAETTILEVPLGYCYNATWRPW